MSKSVYAVLRSDGECEGSTVLAICLNREDAWKAKRKLDKYFAEVLHSPRSRKRFFIRPVVPEAIYPFGIEVNNKILIEAKGT